MDLNAIKDFLEFCEKRGINFMTAAEPVKQAMLDLHKLTASVVNTAVDGTSTKKKAKLVKKASTQKVDIPVATGNLLDGVYKLTARRAFNQESPNIFKVVVPITLDSFGKSKDPFTTDMPLAIKKLIKQLWDTSPELFSKKNLHGGRGHQDTEIYIGEAYVTFNKNNTITTISKFVPNPDLVKNKTKAIVPVLPALAPAKTVIAATPSITELTAFSVMINKSDPQLLNDKMMIMWQYNPQSLNTMNDENIVGRIGELALHRQHSSFEWLNKDMELVGPADFKIPGYNLTLDVKTIKTVKNNLLIKKRKVDSLNLADIFSLALVEDAGSEFRVTFLGFTSKEAVLKHIVNYPPCYMPALDSYKIDKRYLSVKFELTVVFPTV